MNVKLPTDVLYKAVLRGGMAGWMRGKKDDRRAGSEVTKWALLGIEVSTNEIVVCSFAEQGLWNLFSAANPPDAEIVQQGRILVEAYPLLRFLKANKRKGGYITLTTTRLATDEMFDDDLPQVGFLEMICHNASGTVIKWALAAYSPLIFNISNWTPRQNLQPLACIECSPIKNFLKNCSGRCAANEKVEVRVWGGNIAFILTAEDLIVGQFILADNVRSVDKEVFINADFGFDGFKNVISTLHSRSTVELFCHIDQGNIVFKSDGLCHGIPSHIKESFESILAPVVSSWDVEAAALGSPIGHLRRLPAKIVSLRVSNDGMKLTARQAVKTRKRVNEAGNMVEYNVVISGFQGYFPEVGIKVAPTTLYRAIKGFNESRLRLELIQQDPTEDSRLKLLRITAEDQPGESFVFCQ